MANNQITHAGELNEPNLDLDLALEVAGVLLRRPATEKDLTPFHYWSAQAVVRKLMARGLLNDLGVKLAKESGDE